jgi:hypothetical protein
MFRKVSGQRGKFGNHYWRSRMATQGRIDGCRLSLRECEHGLFVLPDNTDRYQIFVLRRPIASIESNLELPCLLSLLLIFKSRESVTLLQRHVECPF